MNSFKLSDLCNLNNQKLNFAIFEKSKLHVFYRGGSHFGICSKFFRFEICDSIDWKGQKIFKKFNEN